MSEDKSNRSPRQEVKIGDRFGRLVVEDHFMVDCPTENYPVNRIRHARCRCDCGTVVILKVPNLRVGNTASCGCLRREMVAAKNTKHGMRKREGGSPPEYFVWKQMRNRCNCTNDPHWDRYGGRGITVCPEWDDFERFLADMGPRSTPRHSIDRIDNDGNYEPNNCRWATLSEQARNKRNNARFLFNGEMLTVAELAERHGIAYAILAQRLRRGWPVLRALSEPVILGKNQYGSP